MKENTTYVKLEVDGLDILRGISSEHDAIRIIGALKVVIELFDEGFDVANVRWKEPSRFDDWFDIIELQQIVESIPIFHEEYTLDATSVLDEFSKRSPLKVVNE